MLYIIMMICSLTFFSAEQEDLFSMLENLLVCLRHCYGELNKVKGAAAISVLQLYQFQYLILAQALRYFHEDAQDGGGLVGVGVGTGYIPTLSPSSQTPGQ